MRLNAVHRVPAERAFIRLCVCVLASRPVRLSALTSLPRPPSQVTAVKKTKKQRSERDGRRRTRRRGKKETFQRSQRETPSVRSRPLHPPSLITLPKKTFTYG